MNRRCWYCGQKITAFWVMLMARRVLVVHLDCVEGAIAKLEEGKG